MTEATSQTAAAAPADATVTAAAPAEAAAAAKTEDAAAASAAAEAKPAEAKPADAAAKEQTPEEKAAAEAAAAEAKVEYADFTLPENSQVDEAIMGEFKEFGQANKLNQEQMQSILNLQQKLNQRMIETAKATREGWRKDSENDKEFGGAKFETSKAAIAKARDAFASQPLVELLDTYGLSDHPEVLRHFYKLGQKISEDSATTTGNSNAQTEELTPAQILYGKPTTK